MSIAITIKTLNTPAAQKYCSAFEDLKREIKRKSFHRATFIRERNLPKDFILACTKLNLIATLGNSQYYVTYLYPCDIMMGKAISLEISKLNELRKQHYNQRNRIAS